MAEYLAVAGPAIAMSFDRTLVGELLREAIDFAGTVPGMIMIFAFLVFVVLLMLYAE